MPSAPAQPDSHPVDDWDDLSVDDKLFEEALAGRSVSWEAVKRWMLSLGTEDELPPPKIGD